MCFPHQNQRSNSYYSCSQLPPALGVFRLFLNQFLINLHEILQALFATIPENFVKFESLFQKLNHLTCSIISRLKAELN